MYPTFFDSIVRSPAFFHEIYRIVVHACNRQEVDDPILSMKQSNPLNPSNKPSKEKVYFPLPNRSGLLGCVVAWNDRPPTLQQLRFPAPPGHRIYISKFFKLTKALEGRSFPLLSHPCLPIGTSKNIVNVYIIATSGLLVRLQWCIRHDLMTS